MDPVSKVQLAQNSADTAQKRRIGRPFPKGVSGNPGGRPKKKYITKMYERILRKAKNRNEIEESFMRILTGGRMASVLMAREMAERTEGKITQELDVNVDATVQYADVVARIRKRKKAVESD
jgi:hypothetical protein